MRACLVLLLLCASAPDAPAQAPQGVPRELARARARTVAGIRYRVHFTLLPKAPNVAGREELRFQLKTAGPLLLDFREGAVNRLAINGMPAPVKEESGHILLPADRLRAGENTVSLDFTAPLAPAGKAITRFEDKSDNTEYLYTLFVPMDASMAFPCFDQPDLKGRFRLEVTAPESWTVISNTGVEKLLPEGTGMRRTVFAETRPISTYLFAFAAGPFRRVPAVGGQPGLFVRQSQLKAAVSEAPEVQQMAARGIVYLQHYFAQPFPFPKYDMVLVPGFPYGGMEHAGATFLREESVLFRTAPTHTDRVNRDLLVLHELTHQWFGDLVTMRWFDDLWLKEGFAQYMAYNTLAALAPAENAWRRFHQTIKPPAYAIDSTRGTTPIYQDIGNLADAKSAYGAIVYAKAPGLLRQLAFLLGDAAFRNGLRFYLGEHLYGNAEWSDLVHAFERASGLSLTEWAEAWIRRRGMPQVDVAWSCDGANRVASLTLSQRDVLGEGRLWPISTQLLLSYGPERAVRLRAQLSDASREIPEAVGKPCPRFIFANDQDYAYGRFLLNRGARDEVMRELSGAAIQDVFQRTLLWGSLWDSVRQAELAPQEFLATALKALPAERDESLAQMLLANVATAMHRYLEDDARKQFAPQVEALASERISHSPDAGLRIVWMRGLRAMAEAPGGLAQLKALLSGKATIQGVELRSLDRWNMVAALLAFKDPDADAIFEAERQHDSSGDAPKHAYMAAAARPDPATKQQYFHDYLRDPSRPEDWIAQSLGPFNYWNQSDLTAPYLTPALQALPQIKQERKIFFLLAWLSAFIHGQTSAGAQAEVHRWLEGANLDRDLQLKVLEVVDELDRTVGIRRRWGQRAQGAGAIEGRPILGIKLR